MPRQRQGENGSKSLTPGSLLRSHRFKRQGMEARIQFVTQQIVDCTMTGQPSHSGKMRRHNADTKMRFSLAVKAFLMSGVEVAFVDDLQVFGRKGLRKFAFDCCLYGHLLYRSPDRFRHQITPLPESFTGIGPKPASMAWRFIKSQFLYRAKNTGYLASHEDEFEIR